MNVLLIATNRERSPYPVAPLGALCVAGAARAAGHQVTLLDLAMVRSPHHAVRKALRAGPFQAVALGIRNLDNCWAFAPRLYFDDIRGLVEVVRSLHQGPIILGGSGFSVAPRGWMERLKPDCGVMGEGERAFPEVLNRLQAGRSLEGIEGVITPAQLGRLEEDPLPAKVIEPLRGLSRAAHDLCRYPAYLRRGGFVGVQTKRGCPFRCIYCIYPQLEGKRYRLRPPEEVVDEIEQVAVKSRLRHFFFVDSVFNDPRAHALAICKELIRRRVPARWAAFCNPVGFDDELAQAMAEAGCTGVEMGLDVATPKMLTALRKPFGQAAIGTSLQAAHNAGMPVAGFMLFGGPGETWADIEEAATFLDGCAPMNAVFATFGIRIYEGTEIAEIAVREGVIKPDQDLFQPAYYLSPALADQTVAKLDRIARQRHEWSSPADWSRPMMRWAQKVMMLLRLRPQWKHIRGYGQHMR